MGFSVSPSQANGRYFKHTVVIVLETLGSKFEVRVLKYSSVV